MITKSTIAADLKKYAKKEYRALRESAMDVIKDSLRETHQIDLINDELEKVLPSLLYNKSRDALSFEKVMAEMKK